MKIESLRQEFKPKVVRALFIGESVPAGGTFFYKGNSALARATMRSFAEAGSLTLNMSDFLDTFKSRGCFLVDLCIEPVDRLPKSDREQARLDGVSRLARILDDTQPEVIFVVMKAIAGEVGEAMRLAGLSDIPMRKFKFPNAYHVDDYVRELAKALRDYEIAP